MIKNRKAWEKFERDRVRREAPDYRKNLRLFDAMVKEAQALGVFPIRNPFSGVQEKIEFAKRLNAL